MVKVCLAFGCKEKFLKESNNDISFYNLPKEKERLQKWLVALKQKNLVVRPFHVICSKHFKEDDFLIDEFGRKVLKPSSIPSIFDKHFHRKHTKPHKISPSKSTNFTSKYNFRERKLQPQIKKTKTKLKNSDHTYSTLKPEIVNKESVNQAKYLDHTYSSNLNESTANIKEKTILIDHTYTRNDNKNAAPVTTKHNEHNYSLNSYKKTGKLEDVSDEINKNKIVLKQKKTDNLYLGAGEVFVVQNNKNPNITVNVKNQTPTLDLRDHTYSKTNKKNKKTVKKKTIQQLKIKKVNPLSEKIIIQHVDENNLNKIVDNKLLPNTNLNTVNNIVDNKLVSNTNLNIVTQNVDVKIKSNEESLVPFEHVDIKTEITEDNENNSTSHEQSINPLIKNEQMQNVINSTKLEQLNLKEKPLHKSDKITKRHSTSRSTRSIKSKSVEYQNPITECVFVTEVGQEKISTERFKQIEDDLLILEPIGKYDNDIHINSNDLNFAPKPFQPVYILMDKKYMKEIKGKAEISMEHANKLFEEVFGKKISDDKISMGTIGNDSFTTDSRCCQRFTEELLRNFANRRRFQLPRYVCDYNIKDMGCERSAKRYYELSKARMDNQKFIITKLRSQNSKLNQRFKKLSREINRMKQNMTYIRKKNVNINKKVSNEAKTER